MNGQGNSRRLLLAGATSKAARNSQTEAEAEETTDVVAEKDSDLESGSEEPLTEKPFTPKQWPKRLASPVLFDTETPKTAKVYDAPQSITFHDMADSCGDQVLQPIYHKLQYELPVPMNQKYQHLSLKMRAKLHGDYLSSINNAIADLAKNSYQMAPQPKPILSSSHCKSSLLKDASTFEEPTVDQSDSPPREDVQRELYVSRSGRHIQRKIYTEDSDGDSEFGSELNISKKNKTDTYDIKITLETPVVTSDSSSKPKDDQKISRLKRPYPGTPKRSLLTMKKTRSEIMFDNLAKDSKKQEQHEAEMEAFQKTLRQEDEIEVDSLSRAWNEEDDANFVPRRVLPPIPRKKPKKSQSKQTAADLDAIVPASPKPGPRSRTIKRPEVAKKRKTPPVESTPESVNCPICGRSFPMDKVQEHASACSDFAMDTEPSQTAIQSTVDTTYNVITANATVPGGIYSDLMNAQIIDDIFYGMGDEEELWISFLDWTYSTTFTIDETILANNVVNIVFDGLDTFCTILINDVEVGRGQNMFIRYIFPIKEHLQLGINSLQVKFFSAVNTAAELAEKQNENYVVPPECPTPESRGACHANFARKMQASFSWDWGPSFPSVGIWKNVYLEAFNDAVIRDVVVKTTEFSGDDVWNLEYTVYLSTEGADQAVGTITMVLNMDDGIDLAAMSDVDATINEYGEIAVANSVNISMSDVRRWWPNGYGDAVLYNLSIDYTSSGSNEKTSKNLRIGFRTVQVVQDQLDSGLSFYFVVNGVPVFAKGANSIPLNVLPERGQDPNTVRNILESAADVHMNMLRVWGGGVYESDYFYETTDELGIMIWQDFMFACAMYPTDDNFLGHVTEEVNHQVKRIFNHPSVVVFAGNNENEAALIQNWYQTSDNYELYKTDYIKLYVTTIRDEVYRVLGSTNFLVSSPTNGQESEAEGYIASNPGDPLYGDVHYYNYQSDSFNDRNFPIPRFSSEFGYQSMPGESAWLTATNDISNLHPASDFVDHRQHHPNGLAENTALIGLQLTLPDESSENYYKAYIYYSQILQAMSIKIETEHYRRYMGRYDEMGQGNTMGALYWQLSDVWVAPTWSGIDFTGRWKMLHYFAKNFFAPLIISPEITDDNQLEVYVVNDAPTGLATNLNAVVQVFTWTSLQPLSDNVYPIAIEPGNVVSATSFAIEEQLASSGCGDYPTSSVNCFFVFYITDDEENVVTFKNFYFPSKLKDSNIQTPNLQIASVLDGLGLGEFEITVSTDTVTPFVWLDSHEISGRFSENGFLMLSETKTVTFTTSTSISAAELQLILTITSLRDSTYT